jgi:hypothetical protein
MGKQHFVSSGVSIAADELISRYPSRSSVVRLSNCGCAAFHASSAFSASLGGR